MQFSLLIVCYGALNVDYNQSTFTEDFVFDEHVVVHLITDLYDWALECYPFTVAHVYCVYGGQ